ncbi:hypothetical protein B0H14DRAFT_2601888 [Mycena olivaceomarginata]|nr:hypothetical protein B0H14DRAFT_2601888 [Mycena olivaceomarginata]
MPPKLSDHDRLARDVKFLGLPAASGGTEDKSASKLSVGDMATLGWRIFTQPSSALWGRDPPQATTVLKPFAKSSPVRIITQIAANREAFMFQGTGRVAMQVSTHYKLHNGSLHLANEVDEERSDTQLLKVCLHYVSAAAEKLAAQREPSVNRDLEWVASRVQNKPDTTARLVTVTPDLVFPAHSIDPQVVEMKKLKEASVISLLRLTGVKSTEGPNISELTVERVVGSALSGIFYNAKKKLSAPLILRPTKPFAYPDIAAVRAAGQDGRIEPVVIIGEGKVRRRGLSDDTESQADGTRTKHTTPTAVAQMAAAVHPTLILLVLAHYERAGLSGSLPNIANETHKFPTFDDKSMVYGIYYDEQQVLIYAHFPQVEQVRIGEFAIRFVQLEVASFPLLGTTFLDRWRMVIALFHVQKHADMISDALTGVIGSYKIADSDK